jgi:hypothetical protein
LALGFNSNPNPGSSLKSILPFTGSGSFKNRSPKEGAIDSPSAEFALNCQTDTWTSNHMKIETYDVFAEIGIGERHDCLEGIWSGTMGDNGDIISCCHPVCSLALHQSGASECRRPPGRPGKQGRRSISEMTRRKETHEATLINSVKPPNHMTSGWIMAKDRFSINFRKPYLQVSDTIPSTILMSSGHRIYSL